MKARKITSTVFWWIGVLLVSCITILPMLWTLSTSFKTNDEIVAGGFHLIPQTWTFQNYIQVFQTVPFGRYILNSVVIAVISVLTNVLLGSLAGYAFARLRFRGRKVMFWMLLASIMVPSIVTMIPQFLILHDIPLVGGNNILGQGGQGLLNTYWAVCLPGAVGAFAVFMMRQQFGDITESYAEAARLDGASEFRIFSRIYMPLAKPAMAVLGIITFQTAWNSFMWPLIVLSDPNMMTVQVGLAAFQNSYANTYTTDFGPLMAGTIISLIPTFVVFIFCQKYILEGVSHVGTK